jgi:hypothetical protein
VLITAAGPDRRDADRRTLAALRHARPAGRHRRQLHELLGPFAVPAQLVRAPPRAGDRHRLLGVGAGSILLLPWLQALILKEGWRAACWSSASSPWWCCCRSTSWSPSGRRMLGLLPDGERTPAGDGEEAPSNVVDASGLATDWTVARAMRTARFWWLAVSFFCGG